MRNSNNNDINSHGRQGQASEMEQKQKLIEKKRITEKAMNLTKRRLVGEMSNKKKELEILKA